MIEMMDNGDYYDIPADPYYHDVGSQHSSITIQYRMHTGMSTLNVGFKLLCLIYL